MMTKHQREKSDRGVGSQGPAWLSALRLGKGFALQDHQIIAIDFSLNRTSSYLGLDPGLGKAVCAAIISSIVGPPVVLISPPFLIANLTEEFRKWAPKLSVASISNKKLNLANTDVLIVPDSILTRTGIIQLILDYRRMFGERDATIIVDEAHRFKNSKSQRTRILFDEIADLFDKKTLMSGTPMPNRPMELYEVLLKFAPETINYMSKFDFGKKYCGGFKDRFGWNFQGASNLKDLGRRVIHPSGPFMLRIKKNAIKLPPKIEELFIISKNMTPQLSSLDRSIGKRYESAEDIIKHSIWQPKEEGGELHVMTYRRLLALEKVRPTAEYIDALLKETDESLLIFALHTEATMVLVEALKKYKPFVITGKTPSAQRQKLVDEFQSCGLKRRLFIGNITAMGIGLTLTKATRVIFMEYSWVPGENDQASDRAHRIGQQDTVYVQYVVYRDSIDKKVLETILQKRKSLRFV